MRLKPGSVPTKFVFTVEKSERKKPCYRATPKLPSKNTNTGFEISSTHCELNNTETIQDNLNPIDEEPIIDDNHELEISENEQLAQEVKSLNETLSHLRKQWDAKELKLNNRIEELERELAEERDARKELELLTSRGTFSIENVKLNPKLLKFYTTFESYELFSMVLDFLGRETASHLNYRNSQKQTSAQTKQYQNKPGPKRTMSVENEFFLTMCRLKVGLLEEDLAARFGVCQSVVSSTINTWIKFLYYRFKELDVFPSSEIVKLHMPECFKKKYPTTTLIIDATEIYMEKPSNPEAQQLTFSSYKNTNTLKALVGIVPKGGISFVSPLFGGSISDKELTARSGLMDKLQRGDVIMADRGFNIGDMLVTKGVRVNVPPFMNQTGQFEESELLETRRIATLRIHVERAMERIKNFHILDSIPITLCRNGIIDMIFFVCVMLSNFQPPLVND